MSGGGDRGIVEGVLASNDMYVIAAHTQGLRRRRLSRPSQLCVLHSMYVVGAITFLYCEGRRFRQDANTREMGGRGGGGRTLRWEVSGSVDAVPRRERASPSSTL